MTRTDAPVSIPMLEIDNTKVGMLWVSSAMKILRARRK